MSTDLKLTGDVIRVLLIEDSEDDAFMVERHLRRAGFNPSVLRVDTEAGMREALRADNSADTADGNGRWDVILADYHLPTFSAPEALKLLKESGDDLPFIVLSGAVSEETAVAAMRAGAHDFVSKQNLTRLVPAIEREVGEAQARRDRMTAEAALRSSEQRFHHLVEAMPLGLLISDGAGRLLYANRAVESLLGYPPGELRSESVTLDGIFEGAANSLFDEPDSARGAKDRQHPPFETQCVTRQGISIPLLVGVTALNPEAPLAERQMAAFLVDLTEQKLSQEAVRRTEKLAATGRLAASIAHEINNPLEAVTNCLYLLNQTNLDPEARHYLDMAQQELDRVVQITTQTLRFYRQNTRPTETDVHELLETVLALYDRRMRAYDIELARDFSNLPQITAYAGEIRQIFANLIGNAIDAMQVSGGTLTLRTAPGRDWRENREGIVVTIADSGAGMSGSTLKRIFEPFFSTKGATGTGLGLWITREILSKHMGKIQVRSHPSAKRDEHNGWTVFRVFLPFSVQPAESHSGGPLSERARAHARREVRTSAASVPGGVSGRAAL